MHYLLFDLFIENNSARENLTRATNVEGEAFGLNDVVDEAFESPFNVTGTTSCFAFKNKTYCKLELFQVYQEILYFGRYLSIRRLRFNSLQWIMFHFIVTFMFF